MTVRSGSLGPDDRLQKHITKGYFTGNSGSEAESIYASFYHGTEFALKHIGRTAARTICDGCEYSDKSPRQVLTMQADAAEAELEMTHEQLRRDRALAALVAARLELELIDVDAGVLPPES